MMNKFVLAAVVGAVVAPAAAQDLITFNFPNNDTRDLIFDMYMVDGVSLTLDNPNGNVAFGDDTFAYILGGLFIDGGLAPNLDFTFSEDVTLVEYTVANDENGGTFDMVQGASSSTGNDVTNFGTFAFSNTTDVFLGNQAVSLLSSNNDGAGYGFSSITVRTVPAPASLAMLGLGGLMTARRRRA